MFLARFRLYHDDCPIVNRCVKFKTDVISFPGHHYTKNGKELVSTFCKFSEDDAKKQEAFLADLRKDPQCTSLDVWGGNFLYEYDLGKGGEHVMLYYNLSMTFVSPTVNSQDGHEYWSVGATKKKTITDFFAQLEEHMTTAEILYVQEDNNIDFAFPLTTEKLSKMQRATLKIALENGYYSFPRKIGLAGIARKTGTSVPTVQEHLRRAEAKILNQRLVI